MDQSDDRRRRSIDRLLWLLIGVVVLTGTLYQVTRIW